MSLKYNKNNIVIKVYCLGRDHQWIEMYLRIVIPSYTVLWNEKLIQARMKFIRTSFFKYFFLSILPTFFLPLLKMSFFLFCFKMEFIFEFLIIVFIVSIWYNTKCKNSSLISLIFFQRVFPSNSEKSYFFHISKMSSFLSCHLFKLKYLYVYMCMNVCMLKRKMEKNF